MNDAFSIRKWIDTRLFAVWLTGYCPFLVMYVTQPLLPSFQQIFHATAAQVSLTVSATKIAVTLVAPFIGLFADSWGRKWVIVPAIFALSVPMFLAATASNLHTLIAWRFIQGLFIPGIFTVALAYISEEWEPTKVGSAMAAYVSGNVFGSVSGRVLAGFAAEHFNWRWAFVALGCLLILGGIATWQWLPRSRHFVRQHNAFASIRIFTQHFRNPKLLAVYAVGFNTLFVFISAFTYITFYLATAPLTMGRWIDKIGQRLTVAIAVCVACFGILLTLVPMLAVVLVGLMLCSTGVFLCQSAASSYIGTIAVHSRSSAAGLYVSSYHLGGTVGAFVPGLFWVVGGWIACVTLIVIVQIVTIGVVVCFWRSRPAKTSKITT